MRAGGKLDGSELGGSALGGSELVGIWTEGSFFISDTLPQTAPGSPPSGHVLSPMDVLLQGKWDGTLKAAYREGIRPLWKYLLPPQWAPAEQRGHELCHVGTRGPQSADISWTSWLGPWKKKDGRRFQREIRWPLATRWGTLVTH